MFLHIFQKVGKSTSLRIGASMLQIIAILVMTQRHQHFQSIYNIPTTPTKCGPVPDLRFGYTPEAIYEFLDLIEESGRKFYLEQMVLWDLFPYMEAYTITLGWLLWKELEKSSFFSEERKHRLIIMVPFIMGCDIIETVSIGYATKVFPDRVGDHWISVSSIANQLKWVLFGGSTILLSCLFVSNYFLNRMWKEGEGNDNDGDSGTGTDTQTDKTKSGKGEKKTN